jgi:hypothetical protein
LRDFLSLCESCETKAGKSVGECLICPRRLYDGPLGEDRSVFAVSPYWAGMSPPDSETVKLDGKEQSKFFALSGERRVTECDRKPTNSAVQSVHG